MINAVCCDPLGMCCAGRGISTNLDRVLLLPSYAMYIVQTKCQVPMEIHSGGRTVFCEGLNLVDVP